MPLVEIIAKTMVMIMRIMTTTMMILVEVG